MRWVLVALVACSSAPPVIPADNGITIFVPPPPAPPTHANANQILAAYGQAYALGVERRAPTAEELRAAADADPVDGIDAEKWREMDPPMRMLRAWDAGQHVAWRAVCRDGVDTWWQSAKAIDDEMAARLAQPVPTDFYAGMAAWRQQWAWWKQRTESDAAFSSLARNEVGAWHRLVVAQDAWATQWEADSIEHTLARGPMLEDGRPIEALDAEQARFCTEKSARRWPPERLHEVGASLRRPTLPTQESGRVARVDATGIHVTRRDRQSFVEMVPPCKRVRCTGLDCNMDERHGWRDVCTEKQVHRVHDVAFLLHVEAAPVVPKVGDNITFFVAPNGHAVLRTVSSSETAAPYFELVIY